jgi:N-acetylglutamate synthase-like GNAT family acetyltransferase
MRQANKFDKPEIIAMLRAFRNESNIEQYQKIENEEYIGQLLDSIFAGRGIAFIEEGKGIIIGIIVPCIWDNTIYVMHELAWWVKPEHRNGSAGSRLLLAYIRHCKELKEQKRIELFTLSKLAKSPDFDYSRLGFKKTDENWMQ